MIDDYSLNEIKKEIEDKRKQLDQLIIDHGVKGEILEFSVELDKLINKYYSIELNKNR